MGRTGIYACGESVSRHNSSELVVPFSLKQEASASIGAGTFTYKIMFYLRGFLMPKLLAILSLLFVFAMPVYGMQVRCTAYTTTENTGIMANGMEAQVGYVACDFLPLGTVIYIDGARYIVGDRIGDGTNNHIDIVFNSYDEAINFGVQYLDMEVA